MKINYSCGFRTVVSYYFFVQNIFFLNSDGLVLTGLIYIIIKLRGLFYVGYLLNMLIVIFIRKSFEPFLSSSFRFRNYIEILTFINRTRPWNLNFWNASFLLTATYTDKRISVYAFILKIFENIIMETYNTGKLLLTNKESKWGS